MTDNKVAELLEQVYLAKLSPHHAEQQINKLIDERVVEELTILYHTPGNLDVVWEKLCARLDAFKSKQKEG